MEHSAYCTNTGASPTPRRVDPRNPRRRAGSCPSGCHPQGGSPRGNATALSMSYDSVRQLLSQMKTVRQVSSPQRGLYELHSPAINETA